MTQGLALGGRRVPHVAPGRRRIAQKLVPVLPPAWPSHSWLMIWHFLGLPAGFGQGKLPEPVGNCWQSTLPTAADGSARAHPHNVKLVPGHSLLKAPCVALTPVSSLSCAGSLIRVSLSLPIRRMDTHECVNKCTRMCTVCDYI